MEPTKEFFKEGRGVEVQGLVFTWWKGRIEEPYEWVCSRPEDPKVGKRLYLDLPEWVTELKESDLLIPEYISEVYRDTKALIPFIMAINFGVLLDRFKELNTFIENLVRELQAETNLLVKNNFTRWISELMMYRHYRYIGPRYQNENVYGILPKMDFSKPVTMDGMNIEFSTTGITSVDFSLNGRQVTIKGHIDSIEMK